MKELLKFFGELLDNNPFVGIIVIALICGTIVEVTSIVFLHKIVSFSFLKHLFD